MEGKQDDSAAMQSAKMEEAGEGGTLAQSAVE